MEDMQDIKDKVNEASIQVYKKDYSEESFLPSSSNMPRSSA